MSALGTEGGNQHTKSVEIKRSQEQRDAWKERVDVGKIMSLMAEAAEGTRQVNPSQINAAALVLDRFIPRLSSTEVTERNELDSLRRGHLGSHPGAVSVGPYVATGASGSAGSGSERCARERHCHSARTYQGQRLRLIRLARCTHIQEVRVWRDRAVVLSGLTRSSPRFPPSRTIDPSFPA